MRSTSTPVRRSACLCAVLLSPACTGPVEESWAGLEIGEEILCEDPVEGFDRLRLETEARGLFIDQDPEPPDGQPRADPAAGGLVISDLDGDGDLDLVLGEYLAFPQVFVNDGDGFFTRSDEPRPPFPEGTRTVGFFGVADLDGDRLPELMLHGAGYTGVSRNLGEMRFSELTTVFLVDEDPRPQIQTAAYGDVDGDGDLDMLLPVVHQDDGTGVDAPSGDGGTELPEPGFDRLYINEGSDTWRLSNELSPLGLPGHAQVAVMTDFDFDGDQDLLVPSEFGDRSEKTALYRNDGLDSDGIPTLVNVAPQLTADIGPGAMGIDSADLNGDGRLDYCMSNFGPPQCLMSYEGGYIEGAAALGLTIPSSFDDWRWSAYSVEFGDFDADGNLDAAIAAGPPSRTSGEPPQPNAIYQGRPGGVMVERTSALGFGDLRRHYGLASGDLDGDGFLDMLVTGTEGEPLLWMNQCGAGAWIELDFEGPGLNVQGFGVIARVTSRGRVQMRELYNLRAVAQGPARLHFGLGEDLESVEHLSVTWPDGAVSEYEDLPVRRRLRVIHPALLD